MNAGTLVEEACCTTAIYKKNPTINHKEAETNQNPDLSTTIQLQYKKFNKHKVSIAMSFAAEEIDA